VRLYFLVEGRHTEKKLYKAWLGHCFPHLRESVKPAGLPTDSFFILSGMGYPSYLQRIPGALEDSARNGVDHLFICIDAEDCSYEERREEIGALLETAARKLRNQGLLYQGQVHIIVADCCIESWLLGHRKLVPRRPADPLLAEFKRFYDVSRDDPERMGSPPDHPLGRAAFHYRYLRQLFQHHGKSYTKERPGMATEANYLAALRDRCLDPASSPTHLASFRLLWETWSTLGGRFDVESALAPREDLHRVRPSGDCP
jgi:hypothetical protein